jgi:UDP-glucose 4-epimerase
MSALIRPVVVTGGAGFIGSEVTRQLVEAGTEVIVVDNLINGKKENLDGLLGQGARLKEIDIRDTEAIGNLFRNAGTVFNLACLGVRHSLHSPIENHEVNATATLQLVKAAYDNNVDRFVHVSTSEVYGTARWTPMGEDHPTTPETVYGASKLAAEAYVRAWYRTHGYPTVIVRPFNAYGPRSHHEGDSGEVIPKMMLRAMAGLSLIVFGDGEQTRDFNFVSDTARGIILAGTSEEAIGETVNIGSGREVSIRELAEKVSATTGRNECQIEFRDPRPGDVKRLCANSTRASSLLGYQPTTKLSEGLKLLLNWYEISGLSPEELLMSEVVENWRLD